MQYCTPSLSRQLSKFVPIRFDDINSSLFFFLLPVHELQTRGRLPFTRSDISGRASFHDSSNKHVAYFHDHKVV